MAEKVLHTENMVEDRRDSLKNIEVSEIKVVKGSEAFHEAKIQDTPSILEGRNLLLLGCMMVGFMCQTMNGFDGSLFNGLTANTVFKTTFNGSSSGSWAAIVSAMYQIGGVVALPAVGPCIDTWGRRAGMFIGSIFIILGTIVSGLSNVNGANLGMFMGGRFLLGFGVSIASAAGPIYVVEMAHPTFRGIATAYANTFWFLGSILAAGAVRGSLGLPRQMSWQVPVWLQIVFSGSICILAFTLPESPRWLYVHGKKEQARSVLAKWHGRGSSENPWVKLQLAEYDQYLNEEGTDKRWWDYSALFKTRSSRYRLACNCVFAIFAQWAGNGVLTYFLPAVLETAGYTEDVVQADINLGYACFQFCFALFGAAWVDRIGRRPLMLFSMSACCVVWIGMTSASAVFANSDETNHSAARACIAMIFIFGAVYSVGLTPLQALYPVEVLSFEMRAKGMAFGSLAVNAGGLLNQFAWPIALKKVGWHTYIVFVIWDAIQTAVFYFMMPETKQRTLEELDDIFAAPNPVKHSLLAHKLALNSDKQVVAVEEI